jgi:hypothetical protein
VCGITRKGRIVQEQILDCIEKAENPVSTRQLALQLGYSWHTVQQYCFELLLKKKIDRIPLAGSHVWIVKGRYTSTPLQNNSDKSKYLEGIPQQKEAEKKLVDAVDKALDEEIAELLQQLQYQLGRKVEQQKKEEKEKVQKQEGEA